MAIIPTHVLYCKHSTTLPIHKVNISVIPTLHVRDIHALTAKTIDYLNCLLTGKVIRNHRKETKDMTGTQ